MTTERPQWSLDELVFVPAIDADHEILAEQLAKVRQAVALRTLVGQAPFYALRLSKSLSAHLAGEERMMRRSEYPGLDWHRRQHNAGRKKMTTLVGAIQAREQERAADALGEFGRWFRDHVGLADRMFAAHLRNDLRSRLPS